MVGVTHRDPGPGPRGAPRRRRLGRAHRRRPSTSTRRSGRSSGASSRPTGCSSSATPSPWPAPGRTQGWLGAAGGARRRRARDARGGRQPGWLGDGARPRGGPRRARRHPRCLTRCAPRAPTRRSCWASTDRGRLALGLRADLVVLDTRRCASVGSCARASTSPGGLSGPDPGPEVRRRPAGADRAWVSGPSPGATMVRLPDSRTRVTVRTTPNRTICSSSRNVPMSSGACRALVAVLLTLIVAPILAVPAPPPIGAARRGSPTELHRRPGQAEHQGEHGLRASNKEQTPFNRQPWGPIIVEEAGRTSAALRVLQRRGPAQPARTMDGHRGQHAAIEPGDKRNLSVSYTLDASMTTRAGPGRIDEGYLYFCVVGQDTDLGSVDVEHPGSRPLQADAVGHAVEITDRGLSSSAPRPRAKIFTCIEGTVDENLADDHAHRARRSRDRAAGLSDEADGWLDGGRSQRRARRWTPSPSSWATTSRARARWSSARRHPATWAGMPAHTTRPASSSSTMSPA